MIKALPKEFLNVITANDALQRYLDSLLRGKDATPRSWLFEEKSPEVVLQDWLDILSALEKGDTFEKEVYQFDTSQLTKWGPQGEVAPISELMTDQVLPTFESTLSALGFDSQAWKKATRNAAIDLRTIGHIRSVRLRDYQHVVDDMRARDTLESNSGWPDFARRNLPDVKRQAVDAAKSGEWSKYPAIALFRNYNMKTRLVWMFPMSANLVESTVEQPFLLACMKSELNFFAPWVGFDRVRKLISRVYEAGAPIYASDFSATDQHFKYRTSQQVVQFSKILLSPEAQRSMEASVYNMHHIPLIVGPDEMVTGEHGLASGSTWTNFLETLFDYAFCEYVSIKHTKWQDRPESLYAIGDDIAWTSPQYSDAFAEEVAARAEEVGQVINSEKVSCSPNKVKTLQRLFQRGYRRPDGLTRGVYSTIRALKSSIYPERFHKPALWSSDMFCARQYMILENCVDHPLFEEFVKFVVKGQRDLIPFAKKSRKDLDRILRGTKLLPGFNPTYNQERRDTSLASFESIRIAKAM